MLRRSAWKTFHERFGPSELAGVGYRFQAAGSWAEPEDALNMRLTDSPVSAVDSFVLPALFKAGGDRECASLPVAFVRRSETTYPKYVINDSDLKGLMMTITSCATR
jgi:hypothetical protein